MKLFTVFICIIILFTAKSFGQQEPPLTKKDIEKLKREQNIIKFLGIRMSKHLIVELEDNKPTGREALLMDTYYNSEGQMDILLYYNAQGNAERFTKFMYDDYGNKTEEVRFEADSSLINGIIYSYNENHHLIKQADYDSAGNILSIHRYEKIGDSLILKVASLPNGKLIYSKKHLYQVPIDNGILISSVTYDNEGNLLDSVHYEFNDDNRVSFKEVFNFTNNKEIQETTKYSYNNNGAVSKIQTNSNNIVEITNIEYDDFGNIIAFITQNTDGNISKYIKIKHFNYTQNK
ncbi:MAG TPA: hypothetical protein PLO05_05720 [Bacteroidales bacterium]|nr:hypothetical protein [Bacteroidales bacterium]MDD4235043.1 hypothetical protein [Bacteroidales bacterium]HXK81635.1 hypothetical protein [Bacteroidales bacterium]